MHLRYTADGMAAGAAFFGPLGERTNAVLDQFSEAELDIVRRFVTAAADALHDHITELEWGASHQSGPPPA